MNVLINISILLFVSALCLIAKQRIDSGFLLIESDKYQKEESYI